MIIAIPVDWRSTVIKLKLLY